MNNEILELTNILDNLKGNNYEVCDYKMPEKEAKMVIAILEQRLGDIKANDKLNVK
jgi:hypothetical protein